MSRNNLKEDDFKVVSYKKPRTKLENKLENSIESVPPERFDLETAIRRIQAAKVDLLASDVYSSITASLKEGLNILHKPEIKEIVCFGLGRLGECTIARYQFALLLCLRDLYNTTTYVYDPIFNENDFNILDAFKFEVLKDNIEGKYKVKEKSSTLFYLPHCPKQLSNNLLWANWGLSLNSCIIIANSFTSVLENNTKQHITKNAYYILDASPYFTELAIINSFKYFSVFNDTAIHIFPWENLSLISQDIWQYHNEPNYPDSDIEYISNKLKEAIKL